MSPALILMASLQLIATRGDDGDEGQIIDIVANSFLTSIQIDKLYWISYTKAYLQQISDHMPLAERRVAFKTAISVIIKRIFDDKSLWETDKAYMGICLFLFMTS